MSVDVVDGPAIVAGYQYRLQIEAEGGLFPEGAVFTAQLRSKVSAASVIATLSTANGGIVRVSDTVVELVVAPELTTGLAAGSVVIDLVRTDLIPPRHLSFFLEIPVVLPVTRGLP
ncbi:hypothetical protein [Bauldia litoralis]|uniref:Uncharacterized protein n=1 Tax=Bauldia litoralis TaxID=665467 RepID=A0A1G6EJD0_9HYPH|nr:hypothetical protein [Bauldia litoralis]SDB57464.1 hypothetical protein SAMN02982931_04564 [Bauldia litoralis]